MSYITTFVVFGAFATLPAVVAQQVRVDYDHGADFSRFHTYNWGKITVSPQVSQLAEQRITSAIEEGLAKKGLRRVESGGDLVVTYQGAVQHQTQLTTFTDGGAGWGMGPRWGYGWGGPSMSTTTAEQIPVGTLVLDMLDPQPKQLVFRGIATDTLSTKPEKNTKKISKAVSKILDKYPPKSNS